MTTTGSGRRFSIHACLGRGGFGEVYRATMSSSGGVTSEVAVKILRADIDPGSEAVKRLRDEGRLLGALRHPSILKVHDLVLLDKRVALVTEYVDGEDLDACIHGEARMPPRVLFAVVGEVASALNVAYNSPAPGADGPMHLVHRDVKPANIRLGKHGEVKLLDFGIARAANVAREAHTANNAMMGSSHYMAPERFLEDDVFPPSDVYALGCILFEGLTGERVFGDRSVKQIYGTMLSPTKFADHLMGRLDLLVPYPEAVRAQVAALLSPNPEDRPTAAQIARDFDDLAEDTQGPTLKRWSRTRTWPAPPQSHGSLNGMDIEAESFVSSRPATPLPEAMGLDPLAPSLLGGDLLGGFDPLGPPPPRNVSPVPAERLPDPVPAEPVEQVAPVDLPDIPARDDRSIDAPLPRAATPVGVERAVEAAPPVQSEAPPVPAALAASVAPASAPEPFHDRDTAPTFSPGVDVAEPAPLVPPVASAPPPPHVPVAAPPPMPVASRAAPRASEAMPKSKAPSHETIAPANDIDEGTASNWLGDDPGPAPDPIPGVFDEPLVTFGGSTDGDAAFERELEAMAARRARSTRMALLGFGAVLVLLVSCGGAYAAYVSIMGGDGFEVAQPERPTPEPADVATPSPTAPPAPTDPVPAATEPKPEPEPDPKPEPEAAKPAPASPKTPAPSPAAPAAGSASQLTKQGWNALDSSPEKAAAAFGKALALAPSNGEASYGMGIALLRLKRSDEAKTHLCAAIRTGSASDAREAKSILEQNGLSCP